MTLIPGGKPDLIETECIHCGSAPSRDWSDILPGAVVCDVCPLHRYEACPEHAPGVLVAETQIEPGIFVRTFSLPQMTKYGYCYESIVVDRNRGRYKSVMRYRTIGEATDGHEWSVTFVCNRRGPRAVI